VPAPVSNVTLDNNGSTNSLHLSFQSAIGDVDSYAVDLVDGQSGSVVQADSLQNSTTEKTFRGLTAGRLYRAEVTTVSGDLNSTGAGKEMCTVPAPVTRLTVANIGSSNSPRVNFFRAIGDVDFYNVNLSCESKQQNNIKNNIVSNNKTDAFIESLTPGKLYRVSMTTVSGVLTIILDEVAVPHTVENVTLENEGTTNSLTVNFTSATGDVTQYTVELVDTTNGSVVKSENLSNDTTVHIFNGLIPGRRYQVHVTTVSGNCTSPPVTDEMCTVPETVQSVTLENNGTTNSLIVNFTSATGDVTQYPVELVDTTNGSVVKSTNLLNNTTVYTFNGLIPGRRYKVHVTTVSGDCTSPPVTAEMCTVAETVQSITLENEGTTTSLTVNFTSATGDVTQYTVELVDTTNGSVVKSENVSNDTTVHSFNGLISGRRYRVIVTTVSGNCTSPPVTDEMCTVPETVQSVTLENNSTTNSLTVNFTSATGDVTQYPVELVDTANGSVVKSDNLSKDTTVYIFNGLIPGRRYQVHVTTVSGNCTSPPVTDEMCTVPETVQSVTLENIGTTNSLTVNFTSATGDVTQYPVELVDTTNRSVVKSTNLLNDTTVYIFNGLIPGRRYQVHVTTVSGNCTSPPVTDEMCTVPKTVQSVTLENNGTTNSLTVNFTSATGDVTQYKVELVDTTNRSVVKSTNLLNDTTVYIFNGLIPGRRYQVHVTTVSGNCTSPPVTDEMCTVPETVQSVTLENEGTTSLTVNFLSATGDVTQYTVELVDTANGFVDKSVNLSNDTTVHSFNDLIPGRRYQVHVTTVSGNCNSTEADAEMCTDPSLVTNLNLDTHHNKNLSVSFDKAYGNVDNYTVILTNGNTSLDSIKHLNPDQTECSFENLQPCTKYHVSVTTSSSFCRNTLESRPQLTLPAAGVNYQRGPCISNHPAIFSPKSIFFLSHVYVLTDPNQVGKVTPKVKNYNHIDIQWVQPEGNVEFFNVVLSKDSSVHWAGVYNSSESSHATGALAYSTTYNVLVEACCQNLCSPDVNVYETQSFSCIHFFNVPVIPLCKWLCGLCFAGPNVILIACLTTAMIVVIACAIENSHSVRSPRSYVELLVRRDSLTMHVIMEDTSNKKKRNPVPFSKFPDYYKKREADSGYLFSEEYQELSSVGKGQAMEAATLAENRTKNRYTNILPFDVTRVKLASVEDIPHSDYINANYIKGHSSSREYIAAQGPLAGTREDFWRMVWEQKVNQIVMLTNCVERGQPKCECYWPMDITPVRYGDIGLVMEWDKPSPEWTIRHLVVKAQHKTDEKRSLYHFHFTAWPDHGVPDTTDSLTNFVRLFRTHVNTTNKGGPIVVHCRCGSSAGVGRTGTFISLDHLLQDIDKKPEIDIYGIVHDMRMSRVLMVQTEMQYIFIHKCILKVLEEEKKKDSDYEVIYSNEGIYENNIVDNFHMEKSNQNN
uniref:protein-tyrosine-phosphatase n=1 Tax=Petromyzon marinus TaxID=7757 RepID=S4R4P5_PETMA